MWAPRATADICEACLAGNWTQALELHKKWFKMCQTLFIESNPIPVKAAAEMMELCGPEVRMPLVEMTDGGKAKLRAAMQEVGLV